MLKPVILFVNDEKVIKDSLISQLQDMHIFRNKSNIRVNDFIGSRYNKKWRGDLLPVDHHRSASCRNQRSEGIR